MAGHSKWANTKHRKERADKKKAKIFTRVIKELISAAKQGGSDPAANPKLAVAIQKAKDVNMPRENVDRNIKKASESGQANYVELLYEVYGKGGVGMIVEIMTDNKNRTASEIRSGLGKKGGALAEPGSVSYMFEKKGVLSLPREGQDEEDLFNRAIEVGAEDILIEEETYEIITPSDQLDVVLKALQNEKTKFSEVKLAYLPQNTLDCSSEDAEANLAIIDWLEDQDDVDAVYHNMA